jgi:hypothetical protein
LGQFDGSAAVMTASINIVLAEPWNLRSNRLRPYRRSRPGWWCNSAEQAASERALDSAVVSERLAVVIANHR